MGFELSSVTFEPFIRVILPSHEEERLVMWIQVSKEGTSPRVQCSITGRGSHSERNWVWKWEDYEPMPDWLKPYFEKGMELINAQNQICAAPGSILTKEFLKTYDLEDAVYRGRMSDFSISQFNEKTNCLGGEDYPDEKPYPMQTTICARTIHYWFKVTDLMWEHWVVK